MRVYNKSIIHAKYLPSKLIGGYFCFLFFLSSMSHPHSIEVSQILSLKEAHALTIENCSALRHSSPERLTTDQIRVMLLFLLKDYDYGVEGQTLGGADFFLKAESEAAEKIDEPAV